MRQVLIRSALVLVCVLSGRGAHATLVNYEAQGELLAIEGELAGLLSLRFDVGDSVSIFYTVDDSLDADLSADPTLGMYAAVVDLSVTIGESTYSGAANLQFFNDRAFGDAYAVINLNTLSGPAPSPLVEYGNFSFNLIDSTRSVFSSTALLTDLPPLSSFDSQVNTLRFWHRSDRTLFGNLEFGIDSLRKVPEPGTFFLFGTGLFGLVGYFRRGR